MKYKEFRRIETVFVVRIKYTYAREEAHCVVKVLASSNKKCNANILSKMNFTSKYVRRN